MAAGATNAYFGSDLMHRLHHLPAFGEGFVEHFTETYADVLALAADNATYAIRDSDVLQYFALDVYAYEVVVPGVGCLGDTAAAEAAPTTTAAAAPTTTASENPAYPTSETVTPSPAAAETPSSVLTVPPVSRGLLGCRRSLTSGLQGCHTHEGGELHCD